MDRRSCSQFDVRGHPRRKVDGPNDLTYYYDRAERLVRVRESWGQQRLLKSFTFADSNGPNDWRKGKLWKTNRHHYDLSIVPEEPPGALIFADGFESGATSAWSDTGHTASSESATSYEARIRETFTYGGKGGRASERVLDLSSRRCRIGGIRGLRESFVGFAHEPAGSRRSQRERASPARKGEPSTKGRATPERASTEP